MNLDEAVRRALEKPTLTDALTSIAVWECERAIKQSKSGYVGPDGKQWDTCFKFCFSRVMREWKKKEYVHV